MWEENQEEFFLSGKIGLCDLITTRDDVYFLLTGRGMDKKRAYQVMEIVRKGRASAVFERSSIGDIVADYDTETQMQILKKIQYLFPKAQAIANVISAVKMAWYKLNYPKEFYQAYFDKVLHDNPEILNAICIVQESINNQIARYSKERNPISYDAFVVAYEMTLRGYQMNNQGQIKSTNCD